MAEAAIDFQPETIDFQAEEASPEEAVRFAATAPQQVVNRTLSTLTAGAPGSEMAKEQSARRSNAIKAAFDSAALPPGATEGRERQFGGYGFSEPLLPIPEIPVKEGESPYATVGKEAANVLLGIPKFLTSPAGIAMAPAAAAFPTVAAGAFTADMLHSLGKQVLETFPNWGKLSPTQRTKALTDIAGTGVLATLTGAQAAKGVRGALPKPVQGPIAEGSILQTPRGAPVPRGEPPAPLEVVSPEVAARQASRMQREATAAMEPARLPKPSVPVGPVEESAPPVAAPPAPKEIATWEDAITELGRVGTGAETRVQIQRLFPQLKLSREVAGDLARATFGDQWKPGGESPGAQPTATGEGPSPQAPEPPASTPAPAPVGIEARVVGGKPLGEWEAVTETAGLPKGDARSVLAKFLAVPNKPTDILRALKNKNRTREIHAPLAPVAPVAQAAPLVEAPPESVAPPVESPATKSVPETTPAPAKTKEPIPETAEPERIVETAVRNPKTGQIVSGKTIHVLLYEKAGLDPVRMTSKEVKESSGYLTSKGRFVTQDEGQEIAQKADQIHPNVPLSGEAVVELSQNEPTPAPSPTPTIAPKAETPPKAAAKEVIKEAQQPLPPEVGPGPIGMGGAALGEIEPTGPRGEPTHGIAARVLEQRRQQGTIAPVEPGEGISPEESVERGRALLAAGADPQKVIEDFNRTKAVSAEGMAIARAYGERLERTAYAMADAHGINSPEYEAAWEADSAWAKAAKPMQTEWHKIGQAQQGETEINTGTFHGLRKAYFDSTGKDFTPQQAEEAVGIAKGVQEAEQGADKAIADVFEEVGKQSAESEPPAVIKPGDIATPGASTLWKRAKAIIDGGETDFDAVRHKLATEFGIPVDKVTKLLSEPKSVKKLTDEMYNKMAERRKVVSQAKNWIRTQQIPPWLHTMRAVPRVFFTAKILGHGTVGMITHAGLNIFNPFAWRTYWPNFFRQYKLVLSGAYHERMMQDLVRDPLFTKARRAGLANDPFKYFDDYQTPTLIKWLDKLGLTGNRGFDALKLFRQARFNQIWNSLPDTLQTPEYAKLVADSVNHATGVVRRPFREWTNWTFFAPRLEASRWAWMVKDPWDAAKTFVDWNKATPEARAFAMSQLKEKAVIAGTYYGLLMANQGLLQASGSEERINFTNPRRTDFLAFKAAGQNIGIVSPMLGIVRLFANLIHAAAGKRGKVESLSSRASEIGSTGFEYARGKLSPFAGFGMDLITQADFQGRPLPFSNDAVPKYLRQQGIGRYTYGEYAAQEFTPIPVSEAVREVWRDQGMNDDQINAYLKALAVGVVAGSTGARVSRVTPPSPITK